MDPMGTYGDLSREQLEGMANALLDACMDLAGAQYTEWILRSIGFGDEELAAAGFDIDGREYGIIDRGEV